MVSRTPPRKILLFNSHTPPAQPSHSTTIPRDTVKDNQTDDELSWVKHGYEAGANKIIQTNDEQSGVKHGYEAGANKIIQTNDEQSGVKHGYEAGANKNNQTDDEQSGVKHGREAGANENNQIDDEQSETKNDNKALENNNSQTDDEQSGITHGHEADANKPESQFTVFQQQGDLLDFLDSIAHGISADFGLGAGLAKQIKGKFPRFFATNKEYKQQVLPAQYLGNEKLVFQLIVKPRFFHKPTYRSLKKSLWALRDHTSFYRINKLGIAHHQVVWINLIGLKCKN